MTESEQALADAQDEAVSTTEAFCADATDYVTALDRYGDVLTAEATTVGDVTTGGADLRQPRADVVESAGEAQAAREAVAAAQDDLADAQAHLAELEASESAMPPADEPEPSAATPVPLAPEDAVRRVQQADAELTAAQEGITDDTPLLQASQQFNAAAVALEMAWLHLLVQAGCLTDDQTVQAQQAWAAYTSALQQSLASAGYYTGAVDGVYGPGTVDAVEALQQAHGLPVTGTVDKATDAALQQDLAALGGAAAQATLLQTTALQQTLKLAGYWDGPVDGQWTPELTQALVRLQTDLGVPATGAVDAATVAAFEAALSAARTPTQEPEPERTDEPEPEESATS